VKTAPLVLLGIGLVILGLAGLVLMVTFLLMVTSGGKIDPDEAAPAFGGGCCCSFFGLAMTVGGLVWWLIARQNKQ
jgi:hypothetical protein